MRTLCGRMRQPRRTASVPITATGRPGAPVSSASRPTPRLGAAERAGADARALGEDQHDESPRSRIARGRAHRVGVAGAAVDRERAERVEDPALPGGWRTAPSWPRSRSAAAPCRRSRTDRGTSGGWPRRSRGPPAGCARARSAAQPEVEVEERLEDGAHDPVDERVDAALARARMMKGVSDPSPAWYPGGARRVTVCGEIDRPRRPRPRGALPERSPPGSGRPSSRSTSASSARLRRRRAARQARHARPARPRGRLGDALAQRRMFGATYANFAHRRSRSLVGAVRLAGLGEHVGLWPLGAFDRPLHPARDELPQASGNRAGPRAGDLAPPAVRDRPRRARAAAERPGRRAGEPKICYDLVQRAAW